MLIVYVCGFGLVLDVWVLEFGLFDVVGAGLQVFRRVVPFGFSLGVVI